ncbi:Phosphatidic acid phosphatase/chloroperoxidase, N-terminal, partial [Cynara cardunculus var. scolymus]
MSGSRCWRVTGGRRREGGDGKEATGGRRREGGDGTAATERNRTSMMDSQQATHTVRSHGLVVARTHMHDWLILSLLVAIFIILNLIHPFHRFVGKDMMDDLKYPMKDSTIPFWTVPVSLTFHLSTNIVKLTNGGFSYFMFLYAVFLPMAVFLAFYFRRRDVYDLHHAVLGLLFSVFITGVLTQVIKDAVGRPRPDFFWRCFPDGIDLYDRWGDVLCHGDIDVVRQGYKSFPSGHTNCLPIHSRFTIPNELSSTRGCRTQIFCDFIAGSFAGLGFLSLYLSGKIKAFDRQGHAAKLCVVFLPLLVASLAAISRFFAPPYHSEGINIGERNFFNPNCFFFTRMLTPLTCGCKGWGPYAFFRALEESCANTSRVSGPPATNNTMGEVEIQQHERNNNSADDLESGT